MAEQSAEDLLTEFCTDVELAGGVTYTDDGVETLVGDDWPDLAAVYLKACMLLKREPKWAT